MVVCCWLHDYTKWLIDRNFALSQFHLSPHSHSFFQQTDDHDQHHYHHYLSWWDDCGKCFSVSVQITLSSQCAQFIVESMCAPSPIKYKMEWNPRPKQPANNRRKKWVYCVDFWMNVKYLRLRKIMLDLDTRHILRTDEHWTMWHISNLIWIGCIDCVCGECDDINCWITFSSSIQRIHVKWNSRRLHWQSVCGVMHKCARGQRYTENTKFKVVKLLSLSFSLVHTHWFTASDEWANRILPIIKMNEKR